MEEILASIKRVIAEDGRPDPRPPRGSRPGEAPRLPGEEDVLELNDPIGEADGLMSDGAASASRHSLAALSAARERSDTLPVGDGPLEAVVRAMLKPMLSDWLDRNLPDIVDRLVAREIARITGKSL